MSARKMSSRKLPHKVRSKSPRERGASIIEFGLIILPMFAMLLLTIDVGWVLFGWASLQEAVREGVRFAVTGQVLAGHPSQADSIRQVIIQYSFGFVNSTNAPSTVAVQYLDPTTFSTSTNAPGNVVKVTISGIKVAPMGPLWRSSTPFLFPRLRPTLSSRIAALASQHPKYAHQIPSRKS